MMAIDSQNHYLFKAARHFDLHHGFSQYDAEFSRLLTRLMLGAVQTVEGAGPWPQGLKEAFSHDFRRYFKAPGAVEWLRDVTSRRCFDIMAFEKRAQEILASIGQNPASIQSRLPGEMLSLLSEETWSRPGLEFPYAAALFEAIFLTNLEDLGLKDNLMSLAEPVMEPGDRKRIQFQTQAHRLQQSVCSVFRHSSCLSWSAAIITGVLSLPLFYAVSFVFWGVCMVTAIELYFLLTWQGFFITSLSTLTLSTIFLCPCFIAVTFSVHVLATTSVYLVDWGFGHSSPRIRGMCSFVQAWGLNPVMCLIHLFILGFPFSLSTISGFSAYIRLRWEWPAYLIRKTQAIETEKTALAFKTFLKCGAHFCESMPKEGLEPTPGCPE